MRGIGSYATGETTCTGDPPSGVNCTPSSAGATQPSDAAGDGEGGADRPRGTNNGGVQAEPVQVVVEDVSPSHPGGPTQIPPAPLFPPDFFNDPRGNASEVTLGGQAHSFGSAI